MLVSGRVDQPHSLGFVSGATMVKSRSSGLQESSRHSTGSRPRRQEAPDKTPPSPRFFQSVMRMAMNDDDASMESLLISPCTLKPDARKMRGGRGDENASALDMDPTGAFNSIALSLRASDGIIPKSSSQSPSPTYTLQSNSMMSALKEEIRQKAMKEPAPPIQSYGQLGQASSSRTFADTGSLSSKSRMTSSSSLVGSITSTPPKYFPVGALGRKGYAARRSNQQVSAAPVTPIKLRVVTGTKPRAAPKMGQGRWRPVTAAASPSADGRRKPIEWGMADTPGGIRTDQFNPYLSRPTYDFDDLDRDGTEAISRFLLSSKQPLSKQMKVQRGKSARPKTSPTRLGAADGPLTFMPPALGAGGVVVVMP